VESKEIETLLQTFRENTVAILEYLEGFRKSFDRTNELYAETLDVLKQLNKEVERLNEFNFGLTNLVRISLIVSSVNLLLLLGYLFYFFYKFR